MGYKAVMREGNSNLVSSIKPESDMEIFFKKDKIVQRVNQSFFMLTLLSACGGGGTSPGSGSSGTVIDGYISGARVFRDSNNDLLINPGEHFVTTNSAGYFSGLAGKSSDILIADSNNGVAIDTVSGLPFLAKLIAPSDYSVITPVTTLVSSLSLNGMQVSEAEAVVISALGLDANINLKSFDPFSDQAVGSSDYKSISIKLSNILMASDGDLNVDSVAGYRSTLDAFSNLLLTSVASGEVIDFSDLAVIQELIPNASSELLAEISGIRRQYCQ